jgi:uncharacterized protein YndB with AHSA1/START domain
VAAAHGSLRAGQTGCPTRSKDRTFLVCLSTGIRSPEPYATIRLHVSHGHRSIDIDAPVERVWKALTSVEEIRAWNQVEIDGRFEAGQEVWMTSIHPQYPGMRWPVQIVEMTEPRRLVWRWHPGAIEAGTDLPREPWTTVTFTLQPTERGTRLTVEETGFDEIALERRAKAYQENTQGWAEVLGWLKTYAEAPR